MANLGELMVQRRAIGDSYDDANDVLKGLKKERDLLDQLILETLEVQGVRKSSVDGIGTASLTTKDVVGVDDWDAFYKYINDTEQPFLLQRRPVGASIMELLNSGDEVPGTNVSEQTTLSFRRN